MKLAVIFLALMVVIQSYRISVLHKHVIALDNNVDSLIRVCKDLLILTKHSLKHQPTDPSEDEKL